ncbi:MAG TPA: YHS domain-containing protein [Longimicrobiaceae bacterium]|nr:YHS domain-containing protein [Longimicrobiaceae bacterium]
MAKVKDPVCGMMIEPDDAVGTSEYEGKTYYFCSDDCKTEFDANPEDYAEEDGSADRP